MLYQENLATLVTLDWQDEILSHELDAMDVATVRRTARKVGRSSARRNEKGS
jgi:hypothetical protein